MRKLAGAGAGEFTHSLNSHFFLMEDRGRQLESESDPGHQIIQQLGSEQEKGDLR